jgi:magnesium-protoporphyrin IX monomethyl ester (oxidative) cyclase
MKVLLLTHPFTIEKTIEGNYGAFPPLGLAYIAAVLERSGHEVKVLDCFAEGFKVRQRHKNKIRIGLPDEDILDRVASFNPGVVGITNNFTSYYDDTITLAKLIKKSFPGVVLMLGGAHITTEYRDVIQQPFVDFIIRGEGEYTAEELLDHLMRNKPLGSIKGLVWKKKDGSVAVNEDREPIADLDALPKPAYHLLNMKLYLRQRSNNFAYSKRFPIGHMITSRGCLYNCIFCSTSKHFKKFRARSADKVLDEIEYLVKKYGVKEVHFHDDSFLCNPGRVKAICNGLLNRNIKISWQISQGITVWGLNPELLGLMYKSGMYRIGLPIESGSERTLKYIRKSVNLRNTIEIIDECSRLGIFTHGNFIIGFPYETKEDIEETSSFIYRSNLDFVKLLICQPLAGSDLYPVYVKENLVQETPRNASTYENTKYDTTVFSAAELNRMRDEIMRNFLRTKIKNILTVNGFKKSVYPKINSMDKLVYSFRLAFISGRRLLSSKSVLGV